MKGWIVAASAALHLVAVAALLPWYDGDDRPQAPPIEVELVQRAAATAGSAPMPEPDSLPAPPIPPLPPGTEAAPRPASSARPATARTAATAAAVNLGDANENRAAIDVTGRNVVPPAPDSTFRNQPPVYPAEAARSGAQGTVSLLVQVSSKGVPTKVTVTGSSGTPSLDREARTAVRRWRFTPAQLQGTPVPFDYALDIRFIIGDTP